jgi:hypothetical protein
MHFDGDKVKKEDDGYDHIEKNRSKNNCSDIRPDVPNIGKCKIANLIFIIHEYQRAMRILS